VVYCNLNNVLFGVQPNHTRAYKRALCEIEWPTGLSTESVVSGYRFGAR